MATIELERGTIEEIEFDDNIGHDELFSHLYLGDGNALCGLPPGQDKHHGCHPGKHWERGMTACPKCGAPLCLGCLLQVV